MIKVFEDGSEVYYCDHCDEPVNPQDFIEDVDTGRDFCDPQCKGSNEQNRAEAANESFIERFYGGEIFTEGERLREAWEIKRKM
jgi:hypothetical protein